MFGGGGDAFLNLLYPPQCLGCDLWYSSDSRAIWCSACEEGVSKGSIMRIVADVPVHSARYYKEPAIARVVHALKYERVADAARLCGSWVALLVRGSQARQTVIIPIPLHAKRLAERGFNQAELIAQEVSRLSGVAIDTTLLERTLYAAPQALSTESERHDQIAYAYKTRRLCDPEVEYVIIDDVVTTGNTLSDAIRAMRTSGARYIRAVTVASTRPN